MRSAGKWARDFFGASPLFLGAEFFLVARWRRGKLGATSMSMQGERELGRDVLRDVSRSFYLTLRALPQSMRPAVSVGYLLARASDTIADCGGERVLRQQLLAEFRYQLQEAGEPDAEFLQAAAAIADEEGLQDGERVLMTRLGEVLQWLSRLQGWEQAAVRKVAATITEGQGWDLAHFPQDQVVALDSDEELLHYCDQVAGCVGVFWTEVGFGSDSRFAKLPFEEMARLGRSYGRGLQLVNILRDVAEDERRGRCYLPGDRGQWLVQAGEYLAEGLRYAKAVRGRRARFATVLPALIGRETLALLQSASPAELQGGVKVSRRTVKRCLRKALFFR